MAVCRLWIAVRHVDDVNVDACVHDDDTLDDANDEVAEGWRKADTEDDVIIMIRLLMMMPMLHVIPVIIY